MTRVEATLFRKMPFPSLFRRRDTRAFAPTESEITSRSVFSELSPAKILVGDSLKDRAVTTVIRESFNPRRNMGLKELVPLSDLDGGCFVCKPIASENGGGKRAAFWLDPKKWQTTLREFAEFAQLNTSEPLKYLIERHVTDGYNESILVKPIIMGSSGVYESGLKYGVQIDGRISLGRDDDGTSEVYDLGYLNPKRLVQAEIDLFQPMLRAER